MTASPQNASSLPIFRAREKNQLHFGLPVFSFSQDVQWDLVGFCANLVKKDYCNLSERHFKEAILEYEENT